MQEVWKDIQGFEGAYQVSSEGRVRGLDRIGETGRRLTGKIISQFKNTCGYYMARLYKCGKMYMFLTSRLVAQTFIPNPHKFETVNHKDEDKQNNKVGNLEWCTITYNNNYGHHNENVSRSMNKPVIQMDLDGFEIRRFDSQKQASETLGIVKVGISRCCAGKYKMSGGFKWRLA